MSTESLLGQHNTCHLKRLPGYTLDNSANEQLLVSQHSETQSYTDQETIELGLPGNSPTSSHLCMTGLQSHPKTHYKNISSIARQAVTFTYIHPKHIGGKTTWPYASRRKMKRKERLRLAASI